MHRGVALVLLATAAFASPVPEEEAERNARLANEALRRCHDYMVAWQKHADPATGLIPTNLTRGKDLWRPADSGADNYPFMVLTASFTDRPAFDGPLLRALDMETRLTSRIGALPDVYSFSKQGFQAEKADLDRILFHASEYIKDGLLPLTEWLGESPWRERMLAILDDIWKHADPLPTNNIEVHGEMVQTLARVYWMTGDKKYLPWALRLGDHYLLGPAHPTRADRHLRLRDHGCEIVSGLCELYVTLHYADPEKKKQYRAPLHEMLDRILAVGRNDDGLFFDMVHPRTGERRGGLADTFGYNLNGFYAVYQVDGTRAYRDAVRKALGALHGKYRNYRWEGQSADGYADAIEGALNLYNREPVATAAEWIDSETKVMWGKQRADGIIEGWHGDGNFARTSLMYALWKTQGVSAHPWREDLLLGAARDGKRLVLFVSAKKPWKGSLTFDRPRHRTHLKLPLDWTRINQFPEWFVVEPGKTYRVDGRETMGGVALALEAGERRVLVVSSAR